ncbi:MAG: TrmH family RNA methyltransferase [Desulfonatronovibrionaceae bacterium]
MHETARDTFITDKRRQRIQSVLGRRQRDFTLVMNNIHDPHNVSAILRSCDAFGIHRVHFVYTSEPFPSLGKKSSASARKWVDITRHTSAADLAGRLSLEGMRVLYTGFGSRASSLPEVDFLPPTAVVLGNEHRGVDEELKRLSHGELYIPMQGMVQSLNVSVAAALILYEAWRQRREAGVLEEKKLLPEEFADCYRQWVEK